MFAGVDRWVLHGARCSPVQIDVQAGLEPMVAVVVVVAAARNGAFSHCSVVWGGFPRARVSGRHRVCFWLMLYFCLMEEEEKERKKKSPWGRRVSPGLDLPCWLCCKSQLLGAIKG
jgi:hypothetical protein